MTLSDSPCSSADLIRTRHSAGRTTHVFNSRPQRVWNSKYSVGIAHSLLLLMGSPTHTVRASTPLAQSSKTIWEINDDGRHSEENSHCFFSFLCLFKRGFVRATQREKSERSEMERVKSVYFFLSVFLFSASPLPFSILFLIYFTLRGKKRKLGEEKKKLFSFYI